MIYSSKITEKQMYIIIQPWHLNLSIIFITYELWPVRAKKKYGIKIKEHQNEKQASVQHHNLILFSNINAQPKADHQKFNQTKVSQLIKELTTLVKIWVCAKALLKFPINNGQYLPSWFMFFHYQGW